MASHRTLVVKLIVIVTGMFAFGYALVPLYKKICEITGINILATQEKTEEIQNTQIDKTRLISVEFDANAQGAWQFHPAVSLLKVHPGEIAQVVYEIKNTEARQVNIQAIPSYAPQQAASYFKKIECFCFKQQTLEPYQSKKMPVVFSIDTALPKNVKVITLSYTFFEVGQSLPNKQSVAF